MYDNYINNTSFRDYRNMINDYIDGYCKFSLDEIEEQIYKSYESDYLSGGQYDYLSALIDDLK